MPKCPSCGFSNAEFAERCTECFQPLDAPKKNIPLTPRVEPPPLPKPNEFIYEPTPSGARPMKLVVEKLGLEILVPQNQESVILGREDPESQFYPDIDTSTYGGNQDGVSRRHARIILKGNQYFVEDLSSVNSTYVNKIKVAGNQLFPLNHEDILTLGRLNFQVFLLETAGAEKSQI